MACIAAGSVNSAEDDMLRTPKIETRGLGKVFTRGDVATAVLVDVNLTVTGGEFVAVVGASGCGKTTLLRILDGLEPVTTGKVLIDGRPLTSPGPDRGFAFQQDNLLPWRSLLRNVMLGLEFQGRPRQFCREEALKYIELVGLAGFEKYYPHELSGGMRQRANLARAFCIEPDIFLMDEPFAALDAQTREVMQSELLRIWNQAAGRTVVFITHQIDEAIFLADRVVVMTSRPGRIKEIVDIPFDRPRTLPLKRTPEFSAIYDKIWQMIEEEVRDSMALTHA